MATTQETEWSEAIQHYLAPGESVEYSYEEPSGDLEVSTGYYALTDRRLI